MHHRSDARRRSTPLRFLRAIAPIAALATFAACCPDDSAVHYEPIDNTEEVLSYYREHPEFFRFAEAGEVPVDLDWEDGSGLPDLGSPNAKKGGVYHARMQDFPRTFRIVGPDANSSFRPYLLDDVMLGFGHLHPNVEGEHQFMPAVAESWAVDRESRTVYVRINPDARWSDGPPVTVDDVFFMFFFYQSAYIRDPWYNNYYGIDITFTNVTRYDDLTFSVTLKEARPDLDRRVLSLRPLPRHFFRELGDDFVERYQWRFMPTTGAYVITDAEAQRIRRNRNRITLTRLEDWWARDLKFWRNRFNPDQLRLTVIRDTPKAFEAFLLGQLDMFGMNIAEFNYEMLPDDHPMVQEGHIHKTTFYNDIPRPTFGLWINSSRKHLDDREVRTGIQYASNWQLVIDQYFRGDYTRMNTSADGYGDMTHPDIEARPFDPRKAREHFARAGFDRMGGDGILQNEHGDRLSFNVSTGYESLRPVLSILREEAMKAGLELRLEILDASANWKKVQEKNHDIAFVAFAVSVEAYPRYWETYHSVNAYDDPYLEDGETPNPDRRPKPQTNNLQVIADPELDRLIDQYDNSDDLDEMRELAFRMEEILHHHASFVPGFVMPFYRVASWRWIEWPEDFNVRFSRDPTEFFLFWVDDEKREETLSARNPALQLANLLLFWRDREERHQPTFPARVRVVDRWKID